MKQLNKFLVVYVFSKFDDIDRFKFFIDSYKKNPPGYPHKFLICFKLLNEEKLKLCRSVASGITYKEFVDPINQNDFESLFLKKKINYKIITVKEITEGAVSTVLLSFKEINKDIPLIIKDCDQVMNWSKDNFMEFVSRKKNDGVLVTVPTMNPGFSYVELKDDMSSVIRTKEKEVVSSFGNTGCYYFNKTSEFEVYANKMIKKNIRVNNEF